MPGGKLPASQTIEGGAQLRVTPHGFTTLTSLVPGLLGDQLTAGICLPAGSIGPIDYCSGNHDGCVNGCRVFPTLKTGAQGVSVTPSTNNTLNIHVAASAKVALVVSFLGASCTINATVSDLSGDVPVALGTNATTGELTITPGAINNFQLSNPDLKDCSFISSVASFIIDLFHGTVSDAIEGAIGPAIQNLLPSFLPNPLGLVGRMDVSQLLAGLLPVTGAHLEARLVPGGYAQVANGGLNLGLITGINADANPATRAAGQDSEPSACVPPLAAPRLGAAPFGLNTTARQTFSLPPAGAFTGAQEPPAANADVAFGISEATLGLLGHHIVTSGALCLGVGTSFVSQLNLGTFSILVPSLADVASGTGNDPLLLVTRPQRALSFTIGDNTEASPAISIGVEHLEADLYAFLYERYVRVFTLDLTLNAGVNLEFEQAAGGPTMIKPVLVGLSPQNVQVTVLNSDFVREPAAQLQAVLPTVFSLVLPLLGDLPEIAVPPLASFEIDNLAIQHVRGGTENFLEVYGSLAASQALRRAASRNPAFNGALSSLATRPSFAAPSTGRARVGNIDTPAPADVRAALQHTGGGLPRVTFDVDRIDDSGRELEWTYQINGGLWRPWQAGALVVEDLAFAWQGKYTIGVKSRVKGDYHTVSATQQFPVIIDSVAPRIAVDKAAWNGDSFEVPAFDIVSGHELSYAFGRPGAAHPESPWMQGDKAQLGRDAASAYADADGKVAVFVKDEAGNTATALVTPGVAQDQGGCAVGGAPGAGGLVLVLVVGGLVLGRRRRGLGAGSAAIGAVGALLLVVQPACGGKNGDKGDDDQPPGGQCEMDSDCAMPCPAGQINFCSDHACACSDDVPVGRVGSYSDVAVAPDGTTAWVSAYSESHGDLVVAQVSTTSADTKVADGGWEWVDGVPAGPIVVPGSTIRGGINAPGADVGMYTSIKVALDGTPIVAYFDRDAGSLKLAQRINGAWQSHVVDAGAGPLDGATGSVVGMYTSLTLRGDNGRAGIAYLAHVKDAAGVHAEVRFASAQVDQPAGAGDWLVSVVDSAPVPAADPANPDVFPLAAGLGLFVDSARLPDQSPVVAYYDRAHGQLKLARFNVAAGKFNAPVVLDGSNGVDAGWTPSVAVDTQGNVDVAYVSATTTDSLHFATTKPGVAPSVIDSGLRTDGTTVDGLPKPVFHFVGANAKLILPGGDLANAYVVYQDATTSELLLGHHNADGTWSHSSVAGATQPYAGGFGFYAAGALGNGQIVMSSFVIDLPDGPGNGDRWVEVFS
ncbi:MAG TPA: hypothetical protein VFP84_39065, partial [Kofleriaceae bacterium]|nr:hypothetical protein [Kofleriaceae bacterium]